VGVDAFIIKRFEAGGDVGDFSLCVFGKIVDIFGVYFVVLFEVDSEFEGEVNCGLYIVGLVLVNGGWLMCIGLVCVVGFVLCEVDDIIGCFVNCFVFFGIVVV